MGAIVFIGKHHKQILETVVLVERAVHGGVLLVRDCITFNPYIKQQKALAERLPEMKMMSVNVQMPANCVAKLAKIREVK